MTPDLAAFDAVLSEISPVRAQNGNAELVLRPVSGDALVCADTRGTLRICLELIIFEAAETPGDDARQVRDIKQQEIYIGPAAEFDSARYAACFRGWSVALGRVLAESDTLSILMPHDLLRLDVLRLKRAHTAEDFAQALLVPSRLGKYLRTPATAPDGTPARATTDGVEALLRRYLPVPIGDRWLDLEADGAPTVTSDTGGVSARLVLRGSGPDAATDGPLQFVPHGHDRERVEAYVDGWVAAMRAVFHDVAPGALHHVRPRDLVAPGVLARPGLRTSQQFYRALLHRAQLGRYRAG